MEAQARRELLCLRYPLNRGRITDWDAMETLWRHTLDKELHVDPKEHPILLTEVPLNPRADRERMTQIMFETFGVPAMYVAMQAALSMYTSGRTTGITVDIGDHGARAVSIYDGYALPNAIRTLDLGGLDLTEHLMKLLSLEGHSFATTADRDLVKDIKEKLCYVALDFDEEMAALRHDPEAMQQDYELPDGQVISLGQQRFSCPEALFQPRLAGLGEQTLGLVNMVQDSIIHCPRNARMELYGHIVLAGGSSLFPGMVDRLQGGLAGLAHPAMAVRITAPPEGEYSPWIGGSILASLSTFQKMWISSEEYDESGPTIVNRKCF